MTSSLSARLSTYLAKPWLRYGLAVSTSLIVIFGLLGYFWLPGYAKGKLQTSLSQALHRSVTVNNIDVSPYALSLTVRGFAIAALPQAATANSNTEAAKSPPLLAFDELYVDLSVMSLVRRVPVISEVRLLGPKIHLERDMDGRYSISDLLDEWMNKPADTNGDKFPAQFSVANIQIDGGHVDFIDHPKGSQQEISDLKLGIPFLANFASGEPIWVEPHFSAKLNGAAIALEGKVLPFGERREATLALNFKDLDLTRIDEYAPLPVKLKLAALKLDTDLRLSFIQSADTAAEISLSGKLRLHDLDLQEAAHGRSLLTLKVLDVQLGALDLAKHAVTVDKILLQGLDADLLRNKNGQLEIASLLTVSATPAKNQTQSKEVAAPAPATTWSVGADETLLENIRVRYRDDSAVTPFIASIAKLDGSIREFELNGDKPMRIEVQVNDVALRPITDKTSLFSTPSATVSGATVSLSRREAAVTTIDIKSPRLTIGRNADGVLDLTLLRAAAAPAPTSSIAEPAATPAATSSWKTKLGAVVLSDAGIDFIDRTLAQPLPLKLAALNVKLNDLDIGGTGLARLDVKGLVNQRGRLQIDGTAAMSPLAVDLAVALKDVDLIPLQGWAGDQLNALLTRGDLSFNGRLKAAGAPMSVAVKGAARLTNFNLLDRENSADLLRWRSFDVDGISLTTSPLKIDVASVSLSDFFAKIILSANGRLNLKDILKHADTPANTEAAIAAPAVLGAPVTPATKPLSPAAQTNAVPVASTPPLPARIGKITLQGGRVDFTDNFIKPNYSANLSALGGRIGPLQAGTLGDVEIRGMVNTSAPLEILGKIDPFSSVLALDIAAKAKSIDLPTFSPYSGKYVGYVIEKGKLSVDVKYRVANGELTAQNSIFIDQLTLGDRVESPDALSIPVTLAVALLKNSRGEIDIQLPVSGSLNDPKFSIGSLIWQVLGNLLVKAVTSPFALLGSLFGGGEELSHVEFSAGRAQLEPEAEKRLQSLAKALSDRNGLKLEITGRADPDNDRDGLKRVVLERKVGAQKLAESVKRGEAVASLQDVKLTADEYPKYLELAYREEKFPKPKNLIGFTKTLPVAEMEQLMLTQIEAGKDEMQQLAERRAQAARDWIVDKGGIAAERVFVLAPKVETEADGKKVSNRAEFSLR